MLQVLEISIPVSPVGLVQQCRAGDGAAWRRLYDEHSVAVHRILLRMGVPPGQLEDARQEVFLEAFKYMPGFRGECSLRTWLYRICISEARRVRQKNRLRSAVQSLLTWGPARDAAASQEFTDSQAEQILGQALRALPAGERDVFVLFELEGMSGAEVAQVLEVPEATVWRRLHYARSRFRTTVEERAQE